MSIIDFIFHSFSFDFHQILKILQCLHEFCMNYYIIHVIFECSVQIFYTVINFSATKELNKKRYCYIALMKCYSIFRVLLFFFAQALKALFYRNTQINEVL